MGRKVNSPKRGAAVPTTSYSTDGSNTIKQKISALKTSTADEWRIH
jgi:hypothetical protein